LENVTYPLTGANATPPPFSLTAPYSGIFAFDPNIKLPYTLQWNATVEQSLGAAQTILVSYVGAAGRRLYRTVVYPEPNPDFIGLRVTSNDASSNYHALQTQFTRRLSRGWQALVSYTWSHSIDNQSVEGSDNLPTSFAGASVEQSRASSDFDRRHSLSAAMTYNLPKVRAGKFGGALLNGWAIDGIYTYLSAAPVNVTFFNFGVNGYTSFRPDYLLNVPLYIADLNVAGGRRINEAAFVLTEDRNGNFPRNALRGFDLSQLDFALRRELRLNERFRLQLRGEVFNAFNRPNFADPDGDLTFGSPFGVSSQMLNRGLGGLNGLYQIGGPRSLQLSLKLNF